MGDHARAVRVHTPWPYPLRLARAARWQHRATACRRVVTVQAARPSTSGDQKDLKVGSTTVGLFEINETNGSLRKAWGMVSRRTVITIPVALAVAGVGTGAVFASASAAEKGGGRGVPKTIAGTRTVGGGHLKATTPERLTHLGISWAGADVKVATRGPDGWQTWDMSAQCTGGPDGQAHDGGHALLVVPGTVEYEVTVSGQAAVTELNTADGPIVATAAELLAGMPLPNGTISPVTYMSRAAWGADEGLRFSGGAELWPAEYAPTQALTVHHTAGANNDPDPAGTIRAIYYYQSVTLGWGDVGYHLFIDEQGRVYEGRWSGSDQVPVFDSTVPDGTSPGLVVAGHVGGYNTGNLGVCLLGNFTKRGPTPAARAALVTVLASLAGVCQVDPEAVVNYVGPTGATRTVLGVSGHRDWAATECPRNRFYPDMPAVRDDVVALMAGTPSPTPTPTKTKKPHGQKP